MSTHLYRSMLAVAALAVLAAGCDRGDTTADAPPMAGVLATSNDEQLATYVQARYQTDPSIAASDIDISARNGVVTLHGTVASDATRNHAATLAQQVEGVRSVENQLRVEPPAASAANPAPARGVESGAAATPVVAQTGNDRTPAWITTKIQAQYFVDTDVKPWNIDVTTRSDGRVTLSGEVDSARAREVAERIARETEGVTGVENRLRVRGERSSTATADNAPAQDAPAHPADAVDRPDVWLTAKVQSKFFMDREVKGRQINVDTQDGIVTLTGEVESASERRQAVALASNTEGVKSVNDQLQIRDAVTAAPANAEPRARSNEQAVEDAWITTIVQSKFFLDREIKGLDINVDTRNGVVTLKGEVESDEERKAAQAIAQETEGVGRVDNQLVVTAREQQR